MKMGTTERSYNSVIAYAVDPNFDPDVQPYRKPGSDLQMSVMDAVTASALAMHDKYMRSKPTLAPVTRCAAWMTL
ncbi:hypothetical protein [Citrobacter freundii]|uniref:hypothetical protein n=1 Tax=Citrobacter freundii TaxID=546 RepID=UPI0020B8731E|nr:hypothetical protein [Citrobacter freundii]